MGFGKERRGEERMPAEIWLQSSASIQFSLGMIARLSQPPPHPHPPFRSLH